MIRMFYMDTISLFIVSTSFLRSVGDLQVDLFQTIKP